jgi:hypothetical protein
VCDFTKKQPFLLSRQIFYFKNFDEDKVQKVMTSKKCGQEIMRAKQVCYQGFLCKCTSKTVEESFVKVSSGIRLGSASLKFLKK